MDFVSSMLIVIDLRLCVRDGREVMRCKVICCS